MGAEQQQEKYDLISLQSQEIESLLDDIPYSGLLPKHAQTLAEVSSLLEFAVLKLSAVRRQF